jgi:hypothetical protein
MFMVPLRYARHCRVQRDVAKEYTVSTTKGLVGKRSFCYQRDQSLGLFASAILVATHLSTASLGSADAEAPIFTNGPRRPALISRYTCDTEHAILLAATGTRSRLGS